MTSQVVGMRPVLGQLRRWVMASLLALTSLVAVAVLTPVHAHSGHQTPKNPSYSADQGNPDGNSAAAERNAPSQAALPAIRPSAGRWHGAASDCPGDGKGELGCCSLAHCLSMMVAVPDSAHSLLFRMLREPVAPVALSIPTGIGHPPDLKPPLAPV